MLVSHTPLVLCVTCPICDARPGHVCREFGKKLIAHADRQEAAQTVFEKTAKKMREGLS